MTEKEKRIVDKLKTIRYHVLVMIRAGGGLLNTTVKIQSI